MANNNKRGIIGFHSQCRGGNREHKVELPCLLIHPCIEYIFLFTESKTWKALL